MNRMELAAKISARSGLTVKQANAALSAALEALADTLAAGEEVSLYGFGSFRPRQRGERTAVHPTTGRPVVVTAARGVVFSPAAALRRRLGPAEAGSEQLNLS